MSMPTWVYKFLRIILAVTVALFPILFGDKLHDLNWRFLSPFAVCTALLALVEILYDQQVDKQAQESSRRASANLDLTRRRLEYQKERGLTMARLMEILIPMSLLVHDLLKVVQDLKKQGEEGEKVAKDSVREGVEKLNSAIEKVLGAVLGEVAAYWGLEEHVINSNLMLGYETHACPEPELQRLENKAEFLVVGRPLRNYKAVLEFAAWGRREPEVPDMSVPVENPGNASTRRKLLPGAPSAFALVQDVVITDTREIDTVARSAAPDLDPDVLRRLKEYFDRMRFRSFASLVLQENGSPVGVLNIQSDQVDIFGRGNSDMETIVKSIEHHRFCLQYLVGSQRRLREAAS
jgi:hypothetical protein